MADARAKDIARKLHAHILQHTEASAGERRRAEEGPRTESVVRRRLSCQLPLQKSAAAADGLSLDRTTPKQVLQQRLRRVRVLRKRRRHSEK